MELLEMSFGKYKVNEVNKTSITSFLQEENYIFKFTRKFINRRNSCIKKNKNKNVLYTFLL